MEIFNYKIVRLFLYERIYNVIFLIFKVTSVNVISTYVINFEKKSISLYNAIFLLYTSYNYRDASMHHNTSMSLLWEAGKQKETEKTFLVLSSVEGRSYIS